jgi:hypothetical protein
MATAAAVETTLAQLRQRKDELAAEMAATRQRLDEARRRVTAARLAGGKPQPKDVAELEQAESLMRQLGDATEALAEQIVSAGAAVAEAERGQRLTTYFAARRQEAAVAREFEQALSRATELCAELVAAGEASVDAGVSAGIERAGGLSSTRLRRNDTIRNGIFSAFYAVVPPPARADFLVPVPLRPPHGVAARLRQLLPDVPPEAENGE